MSTESTQLGKDGENVACEYLVQKGFQIIERNARKPWGEIDIVAKAPDRTLVFIEVKTMHEYTGGLSPEDQMTRDKIRKFKRASTLYAGSRENLIDDDRGWRLDLLAIAVKNNNSLTSKKNIFVIKHYKNIF